MLSCFPYVLRGRGNKSIRSHFYAILPSVPVTTGPSHRTLLIYFSFFLFIKLTSHKEKEKRIFTSQGCLGEM